MKKSDTGARNQCLAAITCNLMTLSYGTACSWAGPNFIVLTSDETPLKSGPLTLSEAAVVVSLLCAGGIVGSAIYGYLMDRCSRRILLVSLAISQIISWVLIYVATDVYYLYAARLIGGIVGGGVFIVAPVYVSEIADDRMRGSLGAMVVLGCNAGVLIAFVVASFTGYYNQIRILIAIPIIFLLIFTYFPETPEYLLKQNQILLAEQSRKFYYGANHIAAVDAIIEATKEPLKEEKCYDKIESAELTFRDFCTPIAQKATLITIFLTTLNQFCGTFAMVNYTNKIFQEAGSSLSANGSSIVVATVQLLANALTMVLVDKAGRKILLVVSSFGTAVGLVGMGLHDIYKVQLAEHNWIPIVAFSFIILSASIGILPLTFVIFMEILPKKIKQVINMIAMVLMWTYAFGLVRYYPLLTQELGMYNCMFGFALCCIVGAIFTLIVIPETKGKSYDQIMKSLE